MSDEVTSHDAISAAQIITALSNELSTERAINAALNAQIESIQSDNLEETLELERTLARYKSVNKSQAQAIDRLNGLIEDRLEETRDLTQKLANANNEWKYWSKLAEDRLKIIESDETSQNLISDLQAKSDSDETKIASLQREWSKALAENEDLRFRLRSIRDTAVRHANDV